MSQIQQLIENSKVNESIARKLFEIETEVLACQSSEELLQRLLALIQAKFQLSGIALLLAEPTPLSYLINGNLQSNWHQKNTKHIAAEKLALLHADKMPVLTNELTQLKSMVPATLLSGADRKSVV